VGLRVASYNVLADSYIRPDRYPRCEPEHLTPAWRHARLASRVGALAAEIVCLQEVEADVLARLAAALPAHEVRWLPKPGRADGVAIATRVPIVAEHRLAYPDETGRVALMVVVLLERRRLGVVSTHLKLDAAIGLSQAEALLEALGSVACDGWVVCGDLNATPGSAIVERLVAGGLADAHAGRGAYTSNFAGGPSRIDYVLHTAAVASEPLVERPSITPESVLPSLDEPSDHLPVVARVGWGDAALPHARRGV
jgi:endonuclease/exonuclease/phosphatase family metal-dependent hydrolase